MKVLGNPIYRIEDVEVDTSKGCLRREGHETYLRQKAFQVLVYLLEQRERLVTKEELMEVVWSETAVTDDALVQCVMDIRRALGDGSRHPHLVKTLPKVGYRFIGAVEELCPARLTQTEQVTSVELEYEEEISNETRGHGDVETRRRFSLPRAATALRLRVALVAALMLILVAAVSIGIRVGKSRLASKRQLAEVTLAQVPGKKPLAVMYFDNQSNSPELDWLRQGLADMLITDLSQSDKLTVLSRQQLRLLLERTGHKQTDNIELDDALDIARRSRAETMVLGSFTRLADKVRIDVQVHDAHSGQLIKAESLIVDRPEQILMQVDLLSLRLAADLGATPNAQDRKTRLADAMTNNLEAYRYYSLALQKAEAYQNREAIALLEKAIALDTQFAMAYARIGYAYAVTWGFAEKGKPYLEKAFQLSQRLTEKDKLYINAWYAIANLDYPGAIRAHRQIISQYPNEAEAYLTLGYLLRGEERLDEAIAALKQGLVIDPEAQNIYNALGFLYSGLGRYDEAIAAHQRYVELASGEPNAHDSLGMTYQEAGHYEQAAAEFEQALALNPEFHFANLHLADLNFQLGRYRKAISQYQRYIRIAPSDRDRAVGYKCLGMLYLRQGDLNEAAVAARKEKGYDKGFVENSFILALKRGDMAAADRLKEKALADWTYTQRGARHQEKERYYLRGYYALKHGQTAEAIESFKEALRHPPIVWNIDGVEDCLANAYLELGQLDEAIAEYERILHLNPNYPLAHYHLAQAYERKGLPNDARAEYERFLQIWKDADADDPEVIAAKRAIGKAA